MQHFADRQKPLKVMKWKGKPVKIERRYYDFANREWDEIMEEVRAEKEGRSEAEEKIAEQKDALILHEIFLQYNEHAHTWKQVPDKERITLFEKLSAEALSAAPLLACNILIEADSSLWGKITLEADVFILPPSENRQLNHIFSDLFLWASDVFFSATASGLCRMEFLYSLHKEIPAEP